MQNEVPHEVNLAKNVPHAIRSSVLCVYECELWFVVYVVYAPTDCALRIECASFMRLLNDTKLYAATNVYGHTTLKAPVLVRSPKLSNVGPG